MSYADQAELNKSGRGFNCSKCPKTIQKLRRCNEEREDFTEKDGNVFPIRIGEGGELYSFCPAKSYRDPEAVYLFNILTIACDTGCMLYSGGIADQPAWFIDNLSWFASAYDMQKFISKAKMILGNEKQGSVKNGTDKGSTRNSR